MAFVPIVILIIGLLTFSLLKIEKEIPYRFHNDEISIDDVDFSNDIRNLIIDENNSKRNQDYYNE